jgi:hypothetical protein
VDETLRLQLGKWWFDHQAPIITEVTGQHVIYRGDDSVGRSRSIQAVVLGLMREIEECGPEVETRVYKRDLSIYTVQ